MQNIQIEQIVSYTLGNKSLRFNNNTWVNNVVIDSRKVSANSLFVAVKGNNNDGHDFVKEIVKDKTCFALVNDDFVLDLPNLIYVRDTIQSLGELAKNYRSNFNIPIVAITGSNGKTTIKEMLKMVLLQKYALTEILVTEGNLNNHLGAPLTLLQLNSSHKIGVIELGMNHAGELDYLSKITNPTHAAINNVLFAHVANFGNISAIAQAKGEIFHGVGDLGTIFIDSNSDFKDLWYDNDVKNQRIVSYGKQTDTCYIRELSVNYAIYQTPLGDLKVSLQILGQHNYINALLVIVISLNLGFSLDQIKCGLESYSGFKGRLEKKIAFNNAMIIDDTYNANPASVKAALSAIQTFTQDKWFILGDLKELGANEASIHYELAKDIQLANIKQLITVGKLAKFTYDAFIGNKLHFETNSDVVKYCKSNLPEDVILLVKASNSMRLFDIVNQIVKNVT